MKKWLENKHWTDWHPAYDKRDTDHGIHGMEVRFYYGNPRDGIVQFVIFTNWHLPHVTEEHDKKYDTHFLCHPMPADVGYHSPNPTYVGQSAMDCDLMEGDECYYDGSALRAEEWFHIFLEKGEEALKKLLEEEWEHYFGVEDE
ncbi:MAG: hypothetical protein MJA29_00290 [Candidatus Omnitrophica bacterium]|nr:hypothetical protein [Candidatus Omnitrophota bacterium]